MGIINDSFMLKNKVAYKLYHEFAKDLPIIDYHCHLQPKMIAEDHRFRNAFDLFLGGDHYKWRQIRSNGVDEEFITGNADEYEKWVCFCRTMPLLIGNPLYHWTCLELKRYFDIDETLLSWITGEVPESAIHEGNKGSFVYIVNAQGLSEMRYVEIDQTYDGWIVVLSGLSGDEQVIAEGHALLAPGMPVHVTTTLTAPASLK